MYIAYNGVNYPCQCRPSATMAYRGLPDDFPAPVSGEITLCADDGFVLRTDNAEDYLRQTFDGGVLVLTNVPEPDEREEIIVPIEAEPSAEELIDILLGVTSDE